MSKECKSVILRSLLGDGSLKKEPKYANIRFKFRHSIVQQDHFYWKVGYMQEIATEKSVQLQKPDGYSLNEKLLFQSGARPHLTELWKIVCDGGNSLVIQRHWLNHLTELSLASWWFDDGSLMRASRQGTFCTDTFSKDHCTTLKNYMFIVWHITFKVRPVKRKNTGKNNYSREIYYRLWFNATEVKKFLPIVLPYAETPLAIKKCLLIYRDPFFQQRWISKMRELLPEKGLCLLDTFLKNSNVLKKSLLQSELENEEEVQFLDEEPSFLASL